MCASAALHNGSSDRFRRSEEVKQTHCRQIKRPCVACARARGCSWVLLSLRLSDGGIDFAPLAAPLPPLLPSTAAGSVMPCGGPGAMRGPGRAMLGGCAMRGTGHARVMPAAHELGLKAPVVLGLEW